MTRHACAAALRRAIPLFALTIALATAHPARAVDGGGEQGSPRERSSSGRGATVPPARAGATEPAPVPLPPPQTDGGKPLMQALALRATSRAFAPEPLPAQTLSNLLWAAWGVNRPAEGKRTAPSARNWQEIDLLVVRADGTFLYDAAAHRLLPVAAGDHRALTGVQPLAKDAPLTLVMVADLSRIKGAEKNPDRHQWIWADAGFISQNIYLFCASEGLATGVRAFVDRPALSKALGLKDYQVVLLAQSVGWPRR